MKIRSSLRNSILLTSVWLLGFALPDWAGQMPAPALSIRRTPTNTFLVSWSGPSGFELQETTNLSAIDWRKATLPVVVGAENQVTVSPAAGSRFFRLQDANPVFNSPTPRIFDPAANITDIYAFLHDDAPKQRLMTALNVFPHEEPAQGPNLYQFDEGVLYQIHVALGPDLAAGRATLSYEFSFTNRFKTNTTILISYLGVVTNINDTAQNLTQSYRVTKVDHRTGVRTSLGSGLVPPNNQGNVTPFYNQGNDGENPAKDGVSGTAALDRYTAQAATNLSLGYTAFAGQRDDAFYGDMQSLFDQLRLRSPGKDSRSGFNVHTIALDIPIVELGSTQQVAGVYATASRQNPSGGWTQVARRGNPLFSELFVPIADQGLYHRSNPAEDGTLFRRYAETPELARLINLVVFGSVVALESNRTDVAGIFIPDLLKCDLSTAPCRLAGSGPGHATNPDHAGFSRLGIFGNDTLQSRVQDPYGNSGVISGGWPNGRRYGDDVVDIAVSILLSDLRGPLIIRVADGVDGVSRNDQGFNKVFPYQGTPHNGRNHAHP